LNNLIDTIKICKKKCKKKEEEKEEKKMKIMKQKI
jgi:hypothetical protein